MAVATAPRPARISTIEVLAQSRANDAGGTGASFGNVWEWTATTFHPFPGFVADPYADYSEPWFGDHRVLRGGSFATRSRLVHARWRNFYRPERSDMFAGFRTCVVGSCKNHTDNKGLAALPLP